MNDILNKYDKYRSVIGPSYLFYAIGSTELKDPEVIIHIYTYKVNSKYNIEVEVISDSKSQSSAIHDCINATLSIIDLSTGLRLESHHILPGFVLNSKVLPKLRSKAYISKCMRDNFNDTYHSYYYRHISINSIIDFLTEVFVGDKNKVEIISGSGNCCICNDFDKYATIKDGKCYCYKHCC